MELSSAAYGLLGVVTGGLITSGFEFLRLRIERRDRLKDSDREFLRQTLLAIHEGLVEMTVIGLATIEKTGEGDVWITPGHVRTDDRYDALTRTIGTLIALTIRSGDIPLRDYVDETCETIINALSARNEGESINESMDLFRAARDKALDRVGELLRDSQAGRTGVRWWPW